MTVDVQNINVTIRQVVPGIVEVNSSTLIIGPTGSGKTSLLATAYEYVYEEYGRVSLHYNSDPGGFPDKLRALMALGIVRVWRMQSRGLEYSFETANLAARGWWPAQIDPKSGMSPRGVRMVPPTMTTYIEICGHCGQEAGRSVVRKTLMHGQCPHCQQVRSETTSKIRQEQAITRGFENIGTRGYDGLTSISSWYLQDLSHRKDLGGEEGALGGKIVSGDLFWRQNNRSQVGFSQERAHELITNALEIPGMVVQPLFTALSNETTDQGGLYVVGAKLSGQAKTDEASGWFGNVFEAALDQTQQGQKVRRLYLSEYIDSQSRRHLLKHRGDPRLVPEFVEDAPYTGETPPQELFTGCNLGNVFRILDQSLQQTIKDAAVRYPNAPGLEAVPSVYGSDVPVEMPTPVVPTAPKPVARPRGRAKTAAAAAAPVAAAQELAHTPAAAVAPSEATPPVVAAQTPAAPAPTLAPTPLSPVEPTLAPPPAAVPSAPAPSVTAGASQAAPGAWAPPPGSPNLAPPRAPGQPPKARPVARPRK